jgi:predicted MFS family arabinose efflux permease
MLELKPLQDIMTTRSTLKRLKAPIALWSIATTFFAFQFILRLSVGILREDIIQKFHIDTAAFGTMAGYYYLGYAGMQIPLGIMLDKFNFRMVTAVAIMITVLGTLTFVLADNWNIVLLGRFLIGAGSAVGFLSVAKVIKLFFEEKYHAFMIGFAFTFGLIGAAIGGAPMRLLFNHFGYYVTFMSLASLGTLIAVVVLIVKDKRIERADTSPNAHPTFKQIINLLCNPKILLVGFAGGLMVGPLEGFADVWAMPFFQHVHNLSENNAIFITSLVFIGMCVGGPLLAYFAKKTGSNILVIAMTGALTVIVFFIVFFVQNLSMLILGTLMFYLGILCCYQVLVFASVSDLVERSCAGIAIAIINCLNMSFGHFFHKIISTTIQKYWDGAMSLAGSPVYNYETYIYGLLVIPVSCLAGTIIFLYMSFLKIKKI